MKNKAQKYFIILFLLLINIAIFVWIFNSKEKDTMKVYFLNVGQGDAIFIEAPNGKQVLIDGGRDTSVVNELGRVMGFFDREIDLIIATHSDQDHIGGLPAVFEKYKVVNFLDSFTESETSTYEALMNLSLEEGSDNKIGLRGQRVILDRQKGVHLLILAPQPDDFEIGEVNDLSVVVKLVYGDTSFLLTGDAGKMVEAGLFASDGDILKSSVLKAGHHGSRTSSASFFVKAVDPNYAVISAGKDNSYGHPHKEVLEVFEKQGVKIINTAEEGTIKFISNGVDVWVK